MLSEARPVRARLGDIEKVKGGLTAWSPERSIEVVKGRPDRRHRSAWFRWLRWWTCVGSATCSRTWAREIEAKIIELDKNRNNVVLSRRAFLEQTSPWCAWASQPVQKGRSGPVWSRASSTSVRSWTWWCGRPVHVSELSWKHIDHPQRGRRGGPEVTVEVLDVDMDRERVSCVAEGDAGRPVAALRPHPRDRSGRAWPGHQTRAVQTFVRCRGHRGPGPHLRAG